MVLTFGFAQALHKGSDPKAHRRWRGCAQESNGRQLRRLLRACRERPRGGLPRRVMKSRRLMSNMELSRAMGDRPVGLSASPAAAWLPRGDRITSAWGSFSTQCPCEPAWAKQQSIG